MGAAQPGGEGVRLQKFMADAGIDSRRRCEQYIRDGLVRVNGVRVTELGTRVVPGRDRVTVNRRAVRARKAGYRTILLNKPRGYVCTRSRGEGRTVFDLLPAAALRLVPAGRLDKNSEGLLLLSDDGALVNLLTHPRHGHAKTYHVTVSGPLDDRALRKLRSRLRIDGYAIRPVQVRALRRSEKPGRTVLQFVLREGRNRQIRKMCALAGLRVHRLVRRKIGDLELGGLRPGTWRELRPGEVAGLKAGRALP